MSAFNNLERLTMFRIMIIMFLLFPILVLAESAEESAPDAAESQEQSAPEDGPVETIHLVNGDRISAALDRTESDMVIVKSPQLGEIKIPWAEIKAIESTRIIYFRLENGNVVAGRAGGLKENKQLIESSFAGDLLINISDILYVGPSEDSVNPDYIRLQEELKDTKENLRQATELGALWSANITAFFSGREGNQNEVAFASSAKVERKAANDTFTAFVAARYTEQDRERSTNEVEGYLKEVVDISKRVFIFGQLEAEWDEANGVDLRFVARLGLGYRILLEGDWEFFEGDKVTLDFEIGGQFTSTDFENTEDIQTGGLTTSIHYRHLFYNKWLLEISGTYDQSFVAPTDDSDDLDDYKLEGLIRLTIPISEVLSFTGEIRNEYSNFIDANAEERNDFYWQFGITISL
jgi:hypothetical protein